jgi:hypothetical protein
MVPVLLDTSSDTYRVGVTTVPKLSTPGRSTPSNGKPSLAEFDPTIPRQQRVRFPLFWHASGRWAKKISGRFAYFGYWRGDNKVSPDEAAKLFNEQKADLYAGRVPKPSERQASGPVTLRDLANRFLTAKLRQMEAKELSPRTFRDYQRAAGQLIKTFGKHRAAEGLEAHGFAAYRAQLAKKHSPEPLARELQMVRTMFKWAFESRLLDRPVPSDPTSRSRR